MTDNVNHPKHYEAGPSVTIECIDVARHLPLPEETPSSTSGVAAKGDREQPSRIWKSPGISGMTGNLIWSRTVTRRKRCSPDPVGTDIRYLALRDIVNGNDIAWERVSSWLEYLKTKHLEVQE